MTRAIVTFTESKKRGLFWLKPSMRHTACVLYDDTGRILVNTNTMGAYAIHNDAIQVANMTYRLTAQGITFIDVPVVQAKFGYPTAYTCVELTKRLIGVNKWWIYTPEQLYNYLERKYGNQEQNTR